MVKSSSSSSRGEKAALKKGPWTAEEDEKLVSYIQQHGHGSWSSLPAKAGLKRCGKSCRLRWTNYLRPDIKRGNFTLQEDQTIIQLHALLGNRWSAIALHLPKRTDNEIKNHWNTCLKKRLTRMGIDPTTHKPLNDTAQGHAGANVNHMAQWETARLQAETRLVRESKLRLQINRQLGSFSSQPPSPTTRLVPNKIPTPPPPPSCLDVLKAWQLQNSWPSSSKSSTPPPTTADNNIPPTHSMYAMMLVSSDDLIKSPTSTLCFPNTIFLNNNNGTDNSIMATFGLTNESFFHYSSTFTDVVNAVGENSPVGSLRDDDDIMVAVEAFRSRGHNKNDNNNSNCNSSKEEVVHSNKEMLVYGFNEKSWSSSPQQNYLGVLNVIGEEESSNFEEKHYWETLLNLVNDFPCS